MISPEYKYVVAIDVGTNSSAYAYAKKEDINLDKNQINVLCNQAWGVGKHNYMKIKTPTSILLDENGELDSFGYKAEYNYDKRVKDGVNDFYFFRNFKMALYKNNPTSEMVIFDVNDRRMMVQTVFSKAISAFMKEFIESITNSGNTISSEEVRWVVTVPSIWSEAAKQIMKKCAHLAGIPDNQLIIALESEAASIYCQYVHSRDIGDTAISVSKIVTQYMVVDLGGIDDKKDNNIEMEETESLGDVKKPTAEDALTGDSSEITIKPLNQEYLEDRKSNAQRTAEMYRNIKQSEAQIYKIYVGLITFQAEQKKTLHINNKQMKAISQHLQQFEDRIDHKAGGKVDIAVNETLGNGFLREIHRPTGADCGGNLINQSLVQELS
ncbi:heat shock 70 kDa protein 12A-like [Mytilus trossulus]|uniref:heat shock 70 kDa protein 12A-like n=1 Tax=Mytilus trossulus TaxID=6551 RepID=UPI00300449A4